MALVCCACFASGVPSSASWERGLGPAQRHAGTGPRAAAEGREHRLRGGGGDSQPKEDELRRLPSRVGFCHWMTTVAVAVPSGLTVRSTQVAVGGRVLDVEEPVLATLCPGGHRCPQAPRLSIPLMMRCCLRSAAIAKPQPSLNHSSGASRTSAGCRQGWLPPRAACPASSQPSRERASSGSVPCS